MESIFDKMVYADSFWWRKNFWVFRCPENIWRCLISFVWPVHNTLAYFSWIFSSDLHPLVSPDGCRTLSREYRSRPMDSTTSEFFWYRSARRHRSLNVILMTFVSSHFSCSAFFSKRANSNDRCVPVCHSIWSPLMRSANDGRKRRLRLNNWNFPIEKNKKVAVHFVSASVASNVYEFVKYWAKSKTISNND